MCTIILITGDNETARATDAFPGCTDLMTSNTPARGRAVVFKSQRVVFDMSSIKRATIINCYIDRLRRIILEHHTLGDEWE